MYDLANITASTGFAAWLRARDTGLALSCNATGELIFVSAQPPERLCVTALQFHRAMGLAVNANRILLADKEHVRCLFRASETADGDSADTKGYATSWSSATGDVDAHEVAVRENGEVIFANTAFSCIATVDGGSAFKPLWKPRFISSLSPDDRCHLNGIAMREGNPAAVSVFAVGDTSKAWRNLRKDGGAIVEIESDRILAEGLSMPHSPRFYRGSLWVLDSGTGYLLRIDSQTRLSERVAFVPGFLRGLSFVDNFALITVSLPKASRVDGLDLCENIGKHGVAPWSGIAIVDLCGGSVVEWLDVGEDVPQLFDVVAIPSARKSWDAPQRTERSSDLQHNQALIDHDK